MQEIRSHILSNYATWGSFRISRARATDRKLTLAVDVFHAIDEHSPRNSKANCSEAASYLSEPVVL